MERQNSFHQRDPLPLPRSGLHPLLTQVWRGNALESQHRVHALVCDAEGRLQAQWGDPNLSFFPRSAIKAIQELCWVAPGYGLRWNLGPEEMAIACGSHDGEEFHIHLVKRWLKALGLGEENLECGVQEPALPSASRALARAGLLPSQLHNNCSGKHCGFLTACLAHGWNTAGYTNYGHPLQFELRNVMEPFFGRNFHQAEWGIDGCGIPTYAVRLRELAVAMARLADPRLLDSQIRKAVAAVNGAVADHPELIGGSESFSSQATAEAKGKIFAKVGAEGVFGAWLPERGLGIAMKCEDGSVRGAEAALSAVLTELGHPLSFYKPLLRRWTGEVVGQFLVH